MILNWKVTQEEHDLIVRIANKAARIAAQHGITYSQRDAVMDLTAVHANGCPLDLEGLAEGLTTDFTHDVFGIADHLDRETGHLMDCFTPRYALANKETN